jgi:transcriptional regulator with XRE-family HTH domain
LKNNRKKQHRGQLLKELVKANGIAISKLAQRVGISRSSYYNHAEDPELSIDLMVKYAKVLNVNLSDYITELGELNATESIPNYLIEASPKNLQEANAIFKLLHKKYCALF